MQNSSPISPAILIIGHYVPSAGFTRVIEHLAMHLGIIYDIHYIGLGYQGKPIFGQIKIYPDVFRNNIDSPGFSELIKKIEPGLVLLVHDIWSLPHYIRAVYKHIRQEKVVTYAAIDSEIIDFGRLSGIQHLDCCVLFNQFSKQQIGNNFPTLNIKDIPHGVDTDLFFPLPNINQEGSPENSRRNAREKLFSGEEDMLDGFIVLNANCCRERKRIDLTIEGFSIFARDKPSNVKLYLHHARTCMLERQEVLKMARQWNVEDRLILNPITDSGSYLSDENLNLLYNACDVGVNTSMGEGWGLVSFEHAATGAPQIVPRHSACAELWEGAADFLEPVDEGIFFFSPFAKMKIIAARDLANKLERLYNDKVYYHMMAAKAYQRATQPAMQWKNIAMQWKYLFDELLVIPHAAKFSA